MTGGAIDLTLDDSDNEEAKEVKQFARNITAAIALSKQTSGHQGAGGQTRWEMEQERIARAAKRELENPSEQASGEASGGSGQASGGWNGVARDAGGVVVPPPAKRARVTTLADLGNDDGPVPAPRPPVAPAMNNAARLGRHNGVMASPRFFDGAIRQTLKIYGGDSMSFADILGPMDEMESAIVTSFSLEQPFLRRHFDNHREIKILVVVPSPNGPPGVIVPLAGTSCSVLSPRPGLTLTGLPMKGRSIFHTKLLVLEYRSFLRIIITSANVMEQDYEILDNKFWIQDFPRLPASSPPAHSYRFSKPLLDHLVSFGVTPAWTSPIFDRFDFLKSDGPESARVVASQQGAWKGWQGIKMGGGLDALARAVASCEFEEGGTWAIECAGSSVGQYSHNWLARFLGACGGIRPKKYYTSDAALPPALSRSVGTTLPIKVVYPTLDEVNRSIMGQRGGGTLFCNNTQFVAASQYFYKSVNKRSQRLAHTKTILAIHEATSPNTHEAALYLGSHNFSKSAWGELSHKKDGPRLQNNNYELGVVIPIRAQSRAELERKMNEAVGYERPLVKYRVGGPNEDLPWNQHAAAAAADPQFGRFDR